MTTTDYHKHCQLLAFEKVLSHGISDKDITVRHYYRLISDIHWRNNGATRLTDNGIDLDIMDFAYHLQRISDRYGYNEILRAYEIDWSSRYPS